MFSQEAVSELLRKKKTRFFLAGLSVLLALAGLVQLVGGDAPATWLKGAGNFLVWAALASMNISKAYARRWLANNVVLAIGVFLLLASWIVKM